MQFDDPGDTPHGCRPSRSLVDIMIQVTGNTVKRVDVLYRSEDVIMLDLDLVSEGVEEAAFDFIVSRGTVSFQVGDSRVEWFGGFGMTNYFGFSHTQGTTMLIALYDARLYNSDRFPVEKLWDTDRVVGARTICCVCGEEIVLYVGEKLWYHTDGSMYCCDRDRQQRKWLAKAAAAHDAYNTAQVVKLGQSFGILESEEAAMELVRLMKHDPSTYASLFRYTLP